MTIIRFSTEGQKAIAMALLNGIKNDTPPMAEAKRLSNRLFTEE